MGKLNRLSWLKKPRLAIPLVIVILIIAAVVLAIMNMNEPAQGSINQTPQAAAEKTDPNAQPGAYRGKYISFSYPARFKAVPDALNGSYLEVNEYHSTDGTGKLINIGVYKGDISTDGGVAYRRLNKKLYRENDSRLGVEFTKVDGTEDTFFIEHNGLLATISATAAGGGLNGEAYFVASSLKWI